MVPAVGPELNNEWVNHLVCIGEKEARLSQAIGHTFQRLLVLNPLAVINGPYP